ncbi:hypothetical protein [Lacticaseibacillus chiayiensis]|uniref:hypothetical protein n=1 Tax=Lacticaseibacillus chiayiensis TaxID=2100821 RepID=UPI001010B68A|nr:hypothetical protein [Lacticaseibacillus chiayiensis]RXT56327.1 hypothetical protein CHT97_11520 [Lacticaseibacillus chiayiensis]
MNYEAFKKYVMTHCHAVSNFRQRAIVYQRLKSTQGCAVSKRDLALEEKAVDAMVEQFVCSAYCNLERYIEEDERNPRQSWIDFIEQQDVLASLEVSANQIFLHDE